MYQATVFSLAVLLTAAILFLYRKKDDSKFNIFLKVFTILFCAVGFFRFMLSDSFIYVINGGWFNGVHYKKTDVLQSVLRWGYYTNYAVLPMAVFYNSRFFRNVASYFCLPFSILSAIFFNDYMEYFLSPKGHGLHLVPWFRYAYFVLELVMAIIIPLLLQIRYKHRFNIKDGREWKNFLIGLPALILVSVPVYLPQSFLGYKVTIPETFGDFHLAWIAILFVVCLALYYIFRFRSYQERLQLCMFLTILLFFHYDSLYLMGFTIKRLPFQLCNIASYFYIIAMSFKLEKMFQFCFIANIVGALIAIFMPDFATGDYSFWTAHYILEHSLVLLVPALVMGLRIFPRLNLRSLKYVFIGFTLYFLFAFSSGLILNGYSDVTGETVNYFFMFDLEMAFDYFPFLTFAGDYPVRFGRFEFYPIVVGIIYVAFSLVCYLFYLLVRFCYKLEDDHLALRGSAIDLYEKITHKESRRPKHFID